MLKKIINILSNRFYNVFLVGSEILELEERLKRCSNLAEIEIVQRDYFNKIK